MATLRTAGCILIWLGLIASASAQTVEDPAIRAAVERYFKALEAEDIDAYLALWSASSAQRPQRASVKFLFDAADERFSDIQIERVVAAGDRLRVRVNVRRERTRPGRDPGAPAIVQTSVGRTALTFVKEADELRVVSEGAPADDLASAFLAATTSEEREALLAAESDLVNTTLVVALARVGTAAATMRQYPRAQTIFERTVELARRTGSRKEEGEALQNLGNTFYFQRRFPEALGAYEQRLPLEQQRGDDAAVASARTGIGTIRYSLAQYSEALTQYRQAWEIQERLDDRLGSASTLISIGNIRYLQGDYPRAIRDYSRSRDLYAAVAYTDGEARALEGLGRTYSAQGNYAAALSAFAGVLAEGRARNDRARQASANQSIADVHLRLGNIDAARKSYEESRDHFIAIQNQSGAGRVWQGLGMTELVAGRLEVAEQAYLRSMTTCDAAEDAECSAHAVVGLGFAQTAQEKFREAISSYKKGIGAFAALQKREAAARAEIGLSQALVGANEIPPAMEAAARARQTAIGFELDDVLWRALTAEARALRKGTDNANALAAARAAAAVVNRMYLAAIEKPATSIPSDASAAFATLAVLQAETGDAAAAWASASWMRALDLRGSLAVNERDIARGMTPEEREQERIMATELLSLFAQSVRERALPKPDATRLAALDERIAAAATSRTAWMEELYKRLPELRLWRGLSPPLEQPATDLAPGTLLLNFVVDDDDLLVLIASPAIERGVAAYVVPIRRRTLAERVNAFLQAEILRDSARWRKVAADVVRLLPSDALPLIASATRIVVMPHDVMWRVPFEALPIGDRYLSSRAQIVYEGSSSALARAAAVGSRPAKTLLGTSSPELTVAAKEQLRQTAPGWIVRASDNADLEMKTIAGMYKSDAAILNGASATEAAFRAQAPGASVLHVAAPFRINGASPLFSPILLSGDGNTSDDDGSLETREIMNLNLRAGVAVLSDGRSTAMIEGAANANAVHWAWLASGVPSIVLARWSTEPAASNALLAEFHRQLVAGKEPSAALDWAQAKIRSKPEWAAPFYWAGWVALGR